MPQDYPPLSQFQSPLGDFGFLKREVPPVTQQHDWECVFQSPLGDFGFLKPVIEPTSARRGNILSFNPLSGILVF